ncbi:TetR/AcrR family transcriptional regulator [Nocardioides sp. ChNu-153]|uniref:TetR/AcrR family transcriptional regulator n=1 Tax=unclassified Nocardioides TaxID=2615069 RepID=UPI0024061106|nr:MULTISPECIES: TetR/AcrR family transcriptional regulator [unclassified Nocardioides]MDF9716706.1 TetR/AcrR family transcriptional regulator [Nocardioides sp. ChNu-99]MDN7121144.1 TetR/AcrR family transcriptional regulator [Nocardioides sp. ChNu-153]
MSTPPAPERPRRPGRSEVRATLLAAATRVFARRGIDAASVDDVAAAAGYTKGAVYSNFTSKDGLVAAIVEDHTAAYLELGLAAAASAEGSLAERARALGDRLDAASADERDWHLLFVELWQRAVRGDPAVEGFRHRRTAMRDAIAAAVREHAEASGAELVVPAEHAAVAIMALANGMALERLVAPDDAPDGLTGELLAGLAASFSRPVAD